jgi:nucleotide-binding universal stress UspA family protein
MVGTFKHIAVFTDGSPQSEALGRHAAELARASDAHLVGIFGVSKDDEQRRADAFARGEKAIDAVIRRQREEAAALALAAVGSLLKSFATMGFRLSSGSSGATTSRRTFCAGRMRT